MVPNVMGFIAGSPRLRVGALLLSASGLCSLVPACADSASDCEARGDCVSAAGHGGGTGSGGAGGAGGAGGGISPDCVPANLGVGEAPDDDCGVFVSASLGNDTSGDGTKAAPFASLTAAIDHGATRLYLCGESFDEAPELPAGTTLFGALACSRAWAYDETSRTLIAPTAETLDEAATVVALRLGPGTMPTALFDVDVTAPAANAPSESSIALLANAVTVELARCDLEAGEPAPGESGPAIAPDPALEGVAGTDGNPALASGICAIDANPGAAGGHKTCGAVVVDGGDGGDALGNPGGGGQEGLPTTPETSGDGGVGAIMGTAACQAGTHGADGADGERGTGGRGIGELTATGHAAAAATVGGASQPGQGGGGGGASGCFSGNTFGSGAGGGSGGCGGAAGAAGGAGGSSIALVSFNAVMSLTGCALTAAAGATAGDGGAGQQPGHGQPGGLSGGGDGCGGGAGGDGGYGGPGGGGAGGHSLAIAFVVSGDGASPTADASTTLTASTGGDGGVGAQEADVLVGDDGLGCEVLDFGGDGVACSSL